MATEQIIVEYIAQVEGMKAQLRTVQTELKAVQKESDNTTDSVNKGFSESEIKIQSNAQKLKELKKELQNLTPGSSQFNKLAKEAGDLQNKINDATEATKAFAKESKLSQGKTLFGALVGDLKQLDFAGAASKAKQLASVVQGISFAEVAGGLKNLVATILNLGKALLLNPFVLITTSVAAATYALYQYTKSYEINTDAIKTNTAALADSAKALDEIQKRIDTINQGLAIADLGDSTKAFVKAQEQLADGLQKIEDKSRETFEQLKKDFGLKDLVVGDLTFDVATLENGKKLSEEAARDLNNRIFEIRKAGKKEELKLQAEFDATVDAISKANVDKQIADSKLVKEKKTEIKKESNKEIVVEESKLGEDLAQIEIKAIAESQDRQRKEIDDYLKNEKEKIETQKELEEKAAADKKSREEAIVQAEFDLFAQSANAIFEYQNNLDNAQIDNLDQSLKRGQISQEQYDKKVAAIRLEQAKRAKTQALFNIAIETAQAVIKSVAISPATFGLPFSAFALLSGGIQAALVASQPLPKFAEGTERVVGGQKGVDSVHALLMPDEAVIKAKENMAYPGLSKAWNSGSLDQFIMDEFITPKLSVILGGSTAENMAKSAKLNRLDEYAMGRAMRRNNGVNVQNADYLAKAIAREMKSDNVKRTWSA